MHCLRQHLAAETQIRGPGQALPLAGQSEGSEASSLSLGFLIRKTVVLALVYIFTATPELEASTAKDRDTEG